MELALDGTKPEPSHEIFEPEANLFTDHKVAVIIPSFNEERFIGSVVLKILQYPVTVIVVDDGSSDTTAAIAKAAGATVIQHDNNLGKGEALNTGLCEARYLQPDAIVMIDGDGQHLPEQLPALVEPVLNGHADIVIGSRYLKRASQVPCHRIIGHWFFNFLTRIASGVSVTDSQSGYRAFSPRAYQADLFQCCDFSVESEMQFMVREHGLTVTEVPITIQYADKSKRSAYKQGLIVLGGILKLTGQYRPLFYFGLLGFLSFLAGMVAGLRVMERFSTNRQIAIGTAMLSLLLSVIGLIMMSTGFTLHSIRGLLTDMLRNRLNGKENS